VRREVLSRRGQGSDEIATHFTGEQTKGRIHNRDGAEGDAVTEFGYEIAAPDVIAESLDGEVLIVNLATGVYFRGDATTSQAWEALTNGTVSTSTQLAADDPITTFIEELLTEGLIRARTTPATALADPGQNYIGPFRLEKFEDLQDMLALDPIHDVDPAAGWPHTK
jgi:hypothetical protein